MSKGIEDVKGVVESLLDTINSLETLISDFDGDNSVLHSKLQEYIVSLKQLHDVAPALTQAGGVSPLEVPMELLQYVDDGGNPDVFLADAVKAAVEANQAARGKVEGFREFRRKLLEGLEKGGYSDDVAAYTSMREEDKS